MDHEPTRGPHEPAVPAAIDASGPLRTASILPFHADPDGARYLNRELSWLQFDERVLALAESPRTPLLERVRFLAIAASNLDEFFQVRVAGLRQQRDADVAGDAPDGLSPREQLAAIRSLAQALASRMSRLLHAELLPALTARRIRILGPEDLGQADRLHLDELFEDRIFPVLTPLAVDPAHPFPYISTLSLNLAVLLADGEGATPRFARVKIPPLLPRLVPLPTADGGAGSAARFVPLELVVASHLDRLFPGVEVLGHHAFRVTRDADIDVAGDEADDLLLALESGLTRRRFGRVVRLEVEPDMPRSVRELLVRELDLDSSDIVESPPPLDLAGLGPVADLDRPDLRWEPFAPVTPPAFVAHAGGPPDVFALLRAGDVLVHHPYDGFASTVQAFIEQAARDPDVLAIKQTLYRTSGPDSPMFRALLDAAASGKQVVALVEVTARFDEEANIGWARALEEAGVHVAYGVVGLKTHTKIALVVRREQEGVRRYAHVGTGNYNERTARLYEDVGLLTCDPGIGADLSELFNMLTGVARRPAFRQLLVAPVGFRSGIERLIVQEAEADDGHIVLKMNALVDRHVIDALVEASQAGARVDLIVRGVCCLRPGVPGVSERIHVRSLVGRYLEHSRIYRFGSAARGMTYLIGSGDLMPRNLDRRVEAVVPVRDPALTARLEEVLRLCLEDDVLAWRLDADSAWRRIPTDRGVDAQAALQALARARAETAVAATRPEPGTEPAGERSGVRPWRRRRP